MHFRYGIQKGTQPRPLRQFKSTGTFLAALRGLVAQLDPVENKKKALLTIGQDGSIFPVHKRGTAKQVTTWIRDTILGDREYAMRELSAKSQVSFELHRYHAPKTGLLITTKIHTGERGTGYILWQQIVVHLTGSEYLWWSHD